ncbi:hypothetical protein [Butyricimonas sp.]|uniref:hypothetical protein n=1 Tax=Butyricimonas sp. TaxID=1969738 RepID=UPI0025BC44C2|nr:hypothetical protein [Butyricimonas sp.]
MTFLKISIVNFYVRFLPQVLFVYFVIIDSINGYLQEFYNLHTPIGILSRGIVLFLVASYLLKENNLFIYKLFKLLAWIYLLAIPLWYLNGSELRIYQESLYLFRFIYFFGVVFYFYSYRGYFSLQKLFDLIIISAFIIGLLNILCFLGGFGIKSYGDDYGFGTKAFYADGNSLGLYMILANCLSIWYAFYMRGKMWLIAIIISLGTMLIGSRAAILGTTLGWVIMLLYFLFVRDNMIKFSKTNKLLVCLIGGGIIIYGIIAVYNFISGFDAYTMERFAIESAVAPRENLIFLGKQVIGDFNWGEVLIGKGFTGGMSALGKLYPSSVEMKSVESDWYDMILSFGWFFGGGMILIQLLLLKGILKAFWKKPSSLSFALFVAGCLWIGASYMAGHGFNNTMLAPLLSVLFITSDKLMRGYDFERTKS